MSITIKDLGKVYKATFGARDTWRNLLLELGVEFSEIETIGTKWKENPNDCYREGLSVWLKNGDRSWRDLVKALSSPTVGHTDIAKEVERQFLQAKATSLVVQSVPSGAYRQPITGELVIFTKKQLGSGAFGQVFKGSYRGMPCAVKLLHHTVMQIRINLPGQQAVEGAVKIFDRECEFLKSFQHDNIVQYLSTEKHPTFGNTILVVELMDCNLRAYFSSLDEESLSSKCQLSLSRDVTSGLAYIHSKRIIHRDLCGDNILLKLAQPEPIAKISDFGMSRLVDPSQLSSTLTAVGHRMGYLPPEASRLNKEQYDSSLDVFSLGVIMVQIVHKLETVKSPRERSLFVAQIPGKHVLKSLIKKCLQENMRRRPPASQVCDKLEVKIAELGVKIAELAPKPQSPKENSLEVAMGKCKLVLFGEGGVGKSEDEYRTIADIDNEVVGLDILDASGLEVFSTFRDRYMLDGEGFLLVYSVSEWSPFQSVAKIIERIKRVKDTDRHVPIVLVGNKCDLDNEREVPRGEGELLARQLQCPFFETSAKLRINIDECFHELVREIRKARAKKAVV